MKTIYDKYVHEYTDEQGRTRYSVGEWSQERAQYSRPLDKRIAELTGCSGEFTKKIEGFPGYFNKRQALRRARYLFGEKEELNNFND